MFNFKPLISLIIEQPEIGLPIFISIMFAIALHEAAHAYSANYLGDNTPKMQGRLTLNPLKHLDPIGTALILIVGIGWGKPVQFNPMNLKKPRRDTALIAFAGPATNIVLASITLLILNLFGNSISTVFYEAVFYFAYINVILAVFNMFPIEPLDGFKVVAGLLPKKLVPQWYQTRQYGIYVLLLFLITGAFTRIIGPASLFILMILDFIFSGFGMF